MLPELRAERQLAAIEAASVPHMDADGHRKTIGKYTRLLGREPGEQRTSLAEALGGLSMRRISEPTKK